MPRLAINPETTVTDRWRLRISESNILFRLIEHVEGRLELTGTQCATGLKLIGKILPDLQAVVVEVAIEHHSLNKLQLEGRLNALGINADKIWNQLNPNVIEHTNNNSCIDIHESEDTNESSVESESVEDDLIEGTTPMDDESES